MPYTSSTQWKRRWRSDYALLFRSTSDEVPLQPLGEREHDGSADAPEERQQSALPVVHTVGEPAVPRLHISRSSGKSHTPLRHSWTACAVGDCGRSSAGAPAAGDDSKFAGTGCVEGVGRAGVRRGLLGDAVTQRICHTVTAAAESCQGTGSGAARRSAEAAARDQQAAVRLLQL